MRHKWGSREIEKKNMSIISEVIQSTKAIIQGMGVTLSYIPKRKWTVQYPDEPVTVQPRYRGQHLLHVDELGREKCVACYLCAAACVRKCRSAVLRPAVRSTLRLPSSAALCCSACLPPLLERVMNLRANG